MSALWPYAPLGGVAQITLGKMVRPVATETEFIEQPYLHAANIRDGGVLNTDHSHRTMWFSPEETLRLNLSAGDVVMAEGGAVGKSAYVADDLEGYGFQNSILRIRAQKDKAEGKFIQYCLQSSFDQGEISRECSTVSIAHFPAEKANRFRIPFPPIETQRCIADYLDRETVEIDAAVADLDKYVELLEKRRHAVAYLYLDEAINDLSAIQVHLGSLGEFVSGSGFPHEYQGVENQEYPFLKVSSLANVNDHARILDFRNTVSKETACALGAKIIPAGSVLMAKIGEAMRLHRFAVNATDCCIDNNLMAISPRLEHMTTDYLRLALNLVTVNVLVNPGPVPSLNVQGLRMFSIPVPSLDAQRKITEAWMLETSEIDSLITEAKKLRDLLLKRRSVLITEVVTGRKQV